MRKSVVLHDRLISARKFGVTEVTVRTNYVLIDFESVQTRSLELLTQEHFKVIVFVRANQGKLPFEVAESLQQLGSSVISDIS